MARKYLTPIDLNQLELQNAKIQNLGSDPSGVTGQVYYNTVANELRVYNGSAWVAVGSTEAVQDIVGNLITAGSGISTSYNDGAGTLTISNTGVTSLTGTANEVTVSASAGAVTISLPNTIVADLTGTASSATYAVTAGTANSVAANSVALGTDTTGNYVASITGTSNEIEVSGSGEGASVQIGLPDNVTLTGSLTVGGNLTVSGSTTYLNTETLTVEDNVILLNSGVTGSPSTNAGLEVERGDSTNTSLIWDESNDSWSATNDGTNYHALARKYVSNVGNSASTVFALTHNLGTRDVTVQVFDNSTYESVEVDVARTSTTVVTITFAVAPSTNAYRVVVTG